MPSCPPRPAHVQAQCTEREPWYQTPFSSQPLPDEWLREWRSGPAPPELHLPEHNPFIPKLFDLVEVGGC